MANDDTRQRVQVAVFDALAPLMGPRSIVAADLIVLIHDHGDIAKPLRIVLGINSVAAMAVMQATVDITEGELDMGEPERTYVPIPVKN